MNNFCKCLSPLMLLCLIGISSLNDYSYLGPTTFFYIYAIACIGIWALFPK